MSIFEMSARGNSATVVQPWVTSRQIRHASTRELTLDGDGESSCSLSTAESEQLQALQESARRQGVQWRVRSGGGYGGGALGGGLVLEVKTDSNDSPCRRPDVCEVERLVARCMTQERPKALMEATAALLDACAVKYGEQVLADEKRSDKIRRLLRLTDELRRANADLTEGS